MSPAIPLATPLPVGAAIVPNSLRAAMEARRARGERFSLNEAVAALVPLCLSIAARHADGERFYVHPSVVEFGKGEGRVKLPTPAPTLPRDRACLAPECRDGDPGDARASVFSIGAIAYELLTGEPVGPGMRRPTEIVPQLPSALELIVGKALVTDASQRPDDLRALASALHHLAPRAALVAPPSVDTTRLESDNDVDVDVKLSMLPPAPKEAAQKAYEVPGGSPPPTDVGPFGAAAQGPIAARVDATSRLADLKRRLENDPRPRYVVVHQGMDHGPFSAVELLQQIGSHQFAGESMLRDAFSKEERPIKDWDEFAPFAEHAKLNRDIKAEKQEMERVIVAEKQATAGKALVGVALVAAVAIVAGAWMLKARAARKAAADIDGDRAMNVEVNGGVKGATKATPGANGRTGTGAGGLPVLPGGLSCEAAQARYVDELRIGGKTGPDLTVGQLGGVLNNGNYLGACGVPNDTKVSVCAAIQNGRAVGVTISMSPHNAGLESCVAGRVRGLSFPSNPRLDIARTSF